MNDNAYPRLNRLLARNRYQSLRIRTAATGLMLMITGLVLASLSSLM